MLDHLRAALGDRYMIERELGRGGMASVWLATDLRHDRTVAIKVLHAELAGAIGVDRFVREIRVTAGLQHPAVVAVLDSGALAGPNGATLPWYAMAFIEGESLRERITRERQLSIADALHIAGQAAGALQAAHERGIIHRDVKPENLLLSGGHVYVADFGIAKALIDTGGERLTSSGIAIGTPAYMSPEQATADRIDARTDQYALACVLYEMLTGEPPFTGRTAQAVMARRLTEPARGLRVVRSTVPEGVEGAVLRALERVPADRFPDVASFAAALTGEHQDPVARRFRGKKWPLAAALAAGMVALAAVSGWLLTRKRATDPRVVSLVQRGHQEYAKRTPAGMTAAIQDFGSAIALDSGSADAWAGLADTYARAVQRRLTLSGVSTDSLLRLAVAASDRALAADGRNANAWVSKAVVAQQLDPTDDRPVFRAVQQALALDSNNARAWHYFAIADAENGRLARALSEWRRAVGSDSSYVEGVAFLAVGYYFARQYDSAARWADSAVALDPTYFLGRTTQGQVAIQTGDRARARAAYEAARRLGTGTSAIEAMLGLAQVEANLGSKAAARRLLQQAESLARGYTPAPLHTAVYFAGVYTALGDGENAVRWLKSYAPSEDLHYQLHLRCDPVLGPMAGDSRFQAIMSKTVTDSTCRNRAS